MERIECQWCRAQNEGGTTWQVCGAPLDSRNKVSDSGWREAPRLRDMTEFGFSRSTCQVEGELVPVAEVDLAPGDGVFFEHHVLLWKDEQTPLGSLNTGGGVKRSLAGVPFVVSTADGPGRVAFSRDSPGELVVLPLHPGMEVDAREHAFLVATHTISYTFERIKGLANLLHGGNGMYLDRFVAQGQPGLLMLHGCGDVFERVLQPGESIEIEPGAFLYKDSGVQMQAVQMDVKTGLFRHGMYLARMTGPGRVGIQSMYVHHDADRAGDDCAGPARLHLPVLQAAERPVRHQLFQLRRGHRRPPGGQPLGLAGTTADPRHDPPAVRTVTRADRG